MSMKKPSKKNGKDFSRAEALDALSQCKALRWSIAALEAKAYDSLRRPVLKVVKTEQVGNKPDS